ncbi:MAG: glycosyltransferase family 87 protein [Chloroflexota bacterium]|nr:glycosyltransferase family 87 protein [Chloroflexota bacterium]
MSSLGLSSRIQINTGTYKTIIAISLTFILVAGMAWFTHQTVIAMYGYRLDFYPRLVGTEAFWAGEMPYSPALTERIQIGMFGAVLSAGEDEQRVAHPAYSFVLLAPLILLPDDVALALWASFQFLAFLIIPFVWFDLVGWKPRPWITIALLLGLVFAFRYPMISYVLGQFVGIMLLSISAGIWCLVRGKPGWAGVVFVFATMPPSFGAPLVVLVLLREVLYRRWRAALVFTGVMSLLFVITLLRIGWWLPEWFANLSAYQEYANPQLAGDLLPSVLQPIFFAAVIGIGIWTLWRTRLISGQEGIVNFTCIVLIMLLLLLPITGSYYLAFLIPILIVSAWRMTQRTTMRLHMGTLFIVVLLSPWLHLSITDGARYQFLTMPLLAALLWWMTQRGSTPNARAPVSRP